ncbi:unnamed protein product, partial [Phaeothamnion confervicola]
AARPAAAGAAGAPPAERMSWEADAPPGPGAPPRRWTRTRSGLWMSGDPAPTVPDFFSYLWEQLRLTQRDQEKDDFGQDDALPHEDATASALSAVTTRPPGGSNGNAAARAEHAAFGMDGGMVSEFMCGMCGLAGIDLRRCGACQGQWYCGRDCQVRHWPLHKAACKRRRAALLTAGGANAGGDADTVPRALTDGTNGPNSDATGPEEPPASTAAATATAARATPAAEPGAQRTSGTAAAAAALLAAAPVPATIPTEYASRMAQLETAIAAARKIPTAEAVRAKAVDAARPPSAGLAALSGKGGDAAGAATRPPSAKATAAATTAALMAPVPPGDTAATETHRLNGNAAARSPRGSRTKGSAGSSERAHAAGAAKAVTAAAAAPSQEAKSGSGASTMGVASAVAVAATA